MSYAAGFARGESESFDDRRAGRTKFMPPAVKGDYQRGYRDGYLPRTAAWGAGRFHGSRFWWNTEREEEAV